MKMASNTLEVGQFYPQNANNNIQIAEREKFNGTASGYATSTNSLFKSR
jgi:hypothetical protein